MIINKRISSSSARLKEAMLIANKTQADLVRETGLSKSTLSRYLSGNFEPKQNAVAKLASSLNVSEMWLWGYDVPKESKKEAATQKDSDMSEARKKLLDIAENCSEEEAENLLQLLELALKMR